MSQGVRRAWKLQEFPAHAANVNCVSLGHKSGRVLVTGGSDKKVNLWAVGKPNCIMSLSGHSTPVDCVRFSISEEQVCAGSAAGALKIWDLESAKMLRTLTGHRASIRCVDFHPYGDFLASGSSDSGIKLWDTRKKGCIFGYKGHNGNVNSLKFSPDGQWIASGGDDNCVKVWDIRVGKVLAEFGEHRGPVSSIEFHPHEFLLASGSMDRTVKFWDLESFSSISSSLPDVPPVRCIAFHPSGACLFSASSEVLRVHGWEPPETHDSVGTTWSKIQDIAISHEQLIGVTMQMTNISIFVVDLRRVHPIGNPSEMRAALNSAGHTLRKNFNKERSSEFAESLSAMKVSEDSDSLPTDPEDDGVFIGVGFREAFHPHRDLARTPPPQPEEFYPPDEDSSLSASNDSVSPRLEPSSGRTNNKFRYITYRNQNQQKTTGNSPRKTSVPNFVPGQPTQNHLCTNNNGHSGVRSRSPVEYLSSRQNSLSDDSSGPYSSRSIDTNRSSRTDSLPSHNGYIGRRETMKPSQSESCIQPPSLGELGHQPSLPQLRDKGSQQNYPQSTLPPLQPLPRSPEKPLAQCQVKPMPKVSSRDVGSNYDYDKTDLSAAHMDDFVPIPIDRPAGLSIDDFLPKSGITMQGGVAIPNLSESEFFMKLAQEHQTFLSVLALRQRNLRIVYNVWQSKDVKAAVDTASGLSDQFILVDILNVLIQRPAIWNLDLCVGVLPSVSQLIQSKYETNIVAGLSVLRLILKNFGSVIKSNIESPIQTVGVDISREERYNKSMECYRQLVTIRAFTLKRQTVPGKVGHNFREIHILLENLD